MTPRPRLNFQIFFDPLLPLVTIRIVQAYPAVSNPPLGTFFGITPLLEVKRYGYHGWPLGQPGPAITSLAGCKDVLFLV